MSIAISHSRREIIDGSFEKTVRYLLQKTFENDKFFTLAEVAKYKPSESFDTWEQTHGKKPQVVEVYHDGEFICDVDESMTKDKIMYRIIGIWKEKMKEKQLKEQKDKGVKI